MRLTNYRIKWSNEDLCYIATTDDYPSIACHGYSVLQAYEELEKVINELSKGV